MRPAQVPVWMPLLQVRRVPPSVGLRPEDVGPRSLGPKCSGEHRCCKRGAPTWLIMGSMVNVCPAFITPTALLRA
eukprot:1413524-Pyramimonas_sp.AAC.2